MRSTTAASSVLLLLSVFLFPAQAHLRQHGRYVARPRQYSPAQSPVSLRLVAPESFGSSGGLDSTLSMDSFAEMSEADPDCTSTFCDSSCTCRQKVKSVVVLAEQENKPAKGMRRSTSYTSALNVESGPAQAYKATLVSSKSSSDIYDLDHQYTRLQSSLFPHIEF
eukprot:CAMPEP_0181287996 /NCGR_PEP_ID=MMETSP1101-20121128/91_1 /TAXON_ID=46948 /ORGANISM="Rhodomonas abbreviata, Strain Caron Lab Isolate" /LENGTH=165 /DNA_ID=CAMNT_0023392077 /DNA_START=54 /DNA_END=551 /DNA_ORIENTATION=+